MKKIILLSSMLAAGLFIIKPASAQFHINVNIGAQPSWGPAGYDYAQYYYLPDVEAYYSVDRSQFVYQDRGNWVFSASLPGRCGNYDLYSGYKVVINERDPWCHFNDHRVRYAPYRFRHDQMMLRDRRDFGNAWGRGAYDRNRGWGNDRRYDDRRFDDRRNDDHRFDERRNDDRRDGYGNDRRGDDRGRGRRW